MGDTFGASQIGPDEDDQEEADIHALDDDADPNPPYDPPIGHTWATWLN